MTDVNDNFDRDLREGHEAEEALILVLEEKGFKKPVQVEGNFKDYDIKTDTGTFEVKRDNASDATGNFFFEYSWRGKPSGIAGTKADFFVIVNPEKTVAYVARTEHVKSFLKDNWKWFSKKLDCGDDKSSNGVLIPKHLYTRTKVIGLEVWKLA